MKRNLFIIFIFILLLSCKTLKVNTSEEEKSFDKMFLETQKFTNKEKYRKSIELLNEIMIKFPEEKTLSINYNIGFNYYKLRNYNEARTYFNRVIKLFETSEYTQQEMNEHRKFIILSRIILEKMEEDKEQQKDPYHIKEDLKDRKKIRAKK